MANERPTTEIEELPESAWPIDLGEASYAYVSIDELVEISSCIVEVQVDDIALSKAYCPYEGGTFEGGTATFKEYTVEVLQNLYGKEEEKTSIIIRCLEEFATDNGGVYDLSHPRFDVIKPGDHAIVFLKQPVPGEGYEISGYGQGFYLIKGENVYRVEGGTAADFISKTELIQITQEALAKLN